MQFIVFYFTAQGASRSWIYTINCETRMCALQQTECPNFRPSHKCSPTWLIKIQWRDNRHTQLHGNNAANLICFGQKQQPKAFSGAFPL